MITILLRKFDDDSMTIRVIPILVLVVMHLAKCLGERILLSDLIVEENVVEENQEAGSPKISQECGLQTDCSSCISLPHCVYCIEPNFEEHRCLYRNSSSHCDLLEDPVSYQDLSVFKNQSLTPDSSVNFVQISPQYVKLKLRPGFTYPLEFTVAQAKQYPVDVYYLMDLSNSMSDDKDNIVQLGGKIAEAVESITNDYQIGFGSFVDKELSPYISLVSSDNCQQKGDNCPAPYSFQHQMSLAKNATEFTERVRNAPISGNIDNPEGGLDALMQVMVCPDEIGWRDRARKVIIYTSDQSFHIALDGKLGGLTKPNDGKCHLNNHGFYEWSTLQDYPSIGHIGEVAREKSVSVIWAVAEAQLNLYTRLTQMIDSSFAGRITEDSSNVVQLVKEMYEKITTTIKMGDNATRDTVDIVYFTNCTRKVLKQRRKCRNIPLGTPVHYTANITLARCTKENVFVEISPEGLEDRLIVEIEPLCDCDCGTEGNVGYQWTSPNCNYKGNNVCGVCNCFDEFFGPRCNCSKAEGINPANPDASCRPPTADPDVAVCSGLGDCICGTCHCFNSSHISGKFCECDNLACDLSANNGLMCGGRGECRCGKCECQPGWSGPSCDCRDDPDACIDPNGDGEACSGRGNCVCGRCECTNDDHSGRYCELCETCPHVCDVIKPCVECLAFNTTVNVVEKGIVSTAYPLQCRDVCEELQIYYKELNTSLVPQDWANCTYKNASYCEFTFSYVESHWKQTTLQLGTDLREVILHLHGDDGDKAVCPIIIPPDYVGIVIGIAGAIVGIGLVTILLWKVFTTITDRLEFARFERERQNMKLPAHSNPIFRQATTTVHNPIYQKNIL